MKPTSFGLAAALMTAALVSTPAFAQERDNHRREAAREQQSKERAQPQQQRERAQAPQQQPPQQQRQAEQARPRRDEGARVQAPQVQAPRGEVRGNEPRGNESRGNEVVGRAVPRTAPSYNNDRERYDRERRYNNERGYDRGRYDGRSYGYYSPRYSPRVYVERPYVFRPRLSIGFGIFAGFPVPYAWRYSAPIYVYGYRAPRVPVYVTPGMSYYGGVALEIAPFDADVYVDGSYAGRVEDFDGSRQPLTLVAGTHRIEVQAPGYAPLVFDVNIEGGQVIPYRGDLRPY